MSNDNSLVNNIDTLIAPIEGSRHGVGEDLIFDPRINAIVAARQEDDPLLAQGNWVTELKVADWDFVKNQCADLLSHTSKDMKLALWYVDALSHTDHLAGISQGLSLLQTLNDEYWLTMYPPLDGEEDSMDIRAGLLSWFVKALSDDIKQLSLSDTKTEKYNYNYYLTARDHDKQRQQNPDSETSNQLTLSDYNHAIKTSSETWQQALMSNLKKVILIQTDITTFTVQAIVNSANKSLLVGGGLDYIIHKKAGPLMKTECIQLHQEKGGCSTGQAEVTTAGNLPAQYLIHAVGPRWLDGERNEPQLLCDAYSNAIMKRL